VLELPELISHHGRSIPDEFSSPTAPRGVPIATGNVF
jgi:hypothetical protein